MVFTLAVQNKINELKTKFEALTHGKEALLQIIEEAEIPECVYNSNAIENSTLTLQETEKVLLELELARKITIREAFEAKNLARIMEYLRAKEQVEISKETVLFFHKMFLTGIDDPAAGRFRQNKEYVRVGTYIAVSPMEIEEKMTKIIVDYSQDTKNYFLGKIAKFHLDFELIHPFVDGNGRVGRILINSQLKNFGLPPIILRNRDRRQYHQAFVTYQNRKNTGEMERLLYLAVCESLHKRLTYLQSKQIVRIADLAKKQNRSLSALLNQARRQTIPAFRERGVWKIGEVGDLGN